MAARVCRMLIGLAVLEMSLAANQSLTMYPMLTNGAYDALIATGAGLDEAAYRAQAGLGRMGGHDVPDRSRGRARTCG